MTRVLLAAAVRSCGLHVRYGRVAVAQAEAEGGAAGARTAAAEAEFSLLRRTLDMMPDAAANLKQLQAS